jgi:aminoglycoside phosphotransferase (APT) family kinase protein
LTTGIQAKISEYYSRLYPHKTGLTIVKVEDIICGWEAQLFTYVVEYQEAEQVVCDERVIRLFQGQSSEKAMREFNILSRLHGVGFPVPEVFHIETETSALGGPFIIMEMVKGCNLSDVLHDVSEEEAERLMTEFTKIWIDLHRLDGSKIIPGFPVGDTNVYLDDVLSMAKGLINDLEVTWFQPVIDWLEARRGTITLEGLSIIHMDYHTRNVMLRDDGRLVVLDWTQVTPGDYRVDLAWTILLMGTYGPSKIRDIILERYERVSGKEAIDIEFFEVIAIARRLLSIIISINMGPEKLGMRSGAVEMMKRDSEHLYKVYDLLKERTGIRLLEFEEFLNSL